VTTAVLTEPTLASAEPPAPVPVPVPEPTRRRLYPPMPADGWKSWIPTFLVTAIAGILHFVHLSQPPGQIFDEIYYAKEGDDLLYHGVEWDHNSNSAEYVVHPPLGKWIIALGIRIVGWIEGNNGYHEYGWRVAAAVVGTLAVLVTIRTGRRLFRSTVLGCAAGLFMALDGLEFVLSRVALLDIFLMFFVLAPFAFLVIDRDQRRRRWLRALEEGRKRPRAAVPWWRLASAVMIGCAMSVKWSALWYIVLFGLLALVWEAGARRSAGVRRWWADAIAGELPWLVLSGVLVVLTYLASWTGWFLSDNGYNRHWLASTGKSEPPVIGALQNLYHYHMEALNFHNGLDAGHQYQSWPWQWLLLGRPVAFYWNGNGPCGAAKCAAEVLLLGTPILWWGFIPALAGLAWFGISRRDWRALALGLGVVAGIVPWFPWEIEHRTMFYFYVLPAEPFLVLTLTYVLGALIRRPTYAGELYAAGGTELLDPAERRAMGVIFGAAVVLAVAIIFAYFYPIYVGSNITYDQWLARMWLGNRWI
jgi:dolichyl-phosphate-mannose-protein mannosyltransferase